MSKSNDRRILEFMDWLRETYQCPEHPDHPVSLEPEHSGFPPIKNSVFGHGCVITCTADSRYVDVKSKTTTGTCMWHVHIDDLRQMKVR